jgi:amino acid permease
VAALFVFPVALLTYLCHESMILGRKTYYQFVIMYEQLVSCVLPVCVFAFYYIMTAPHLVESSRSVSQNTLNPRLKIRKYTAKIELGFTVVFLTSYVRYHAFWTHIICTAKHCLS